MHSVLYGLFLIILRIMIRSQAYFIRQISRYVILSRL